MRIFTSLFKSRPAVRAALQNPSQLSQRPTDLLVVVNPKAGRIVRKKQDREAIISFGRQHGRVISENGLDAQAQAIADAFKEWPEGRPPLVACHGGDGTLHEVMKAVIQVNGEKSLPNFLPLSAGTMNVVWKNLGYRGALPTVLASAHAWLLAGGLAAHEKSLLRIHSSLRAETLYGFIFANGALYNMIREFESDANHSALGFFKIGSKLVLQPSYRQNVLGKNPIETTLPDGELLEGPMTGALMSTLNRLMFGVQLFDRDLNGSDESGLMFSRYSPGQMFFRWPGVLWRLLRPAFFVRPPQHFSDAVIGPVTFAGPCGFSIDGELYPSTANQTIRVEPGPLVRFPKI